MRLTVEQIRAVARGVVRVEEKEGKVSLHRFTEAQERMYRSRSTASYLRAFATAGVILEFETDSEKLELSAEIFPASSRTFFVHSIFVNERRIGELAGEIRNGTKRASCEGFFELGSGWKRVKILFPWTVASQIRALTLEEGSRLVPVKKSRKILLYGDSITQGYDAVKPENSYASRLVSWMDADGINKAIGGETFFPELAELTDDCIPDLITVAYGTNDWRHSPRDMFLENSQEFFRILRRNYPSVPIIALIPIWRADIDEKTSVGDFRSIASHYQRIAAEIGDMTVIDCFDFVPQNPKCFRDLRLHPNDEGFRFYADRLQEALENARKK